MDDELLTNRNSIKMGIINANRQFAKPRKKITEMEVIAQKP